MTIRFIEVTCINPETGDACMTWMNPAFIQTMNTMPIEQEGAPFLKGLTCILWNGDPDAMYVLETPDAIMAAFYTH
jgi:hypothetical protein